MSLISSTVPDNTQHPFSYTISKDSPCQLKLGMYPSFSLSVFSIHQLPSQKLCVCWSWHQQQSLWQHYITSHFLFLIVIDLPWNPDDGGMSIWSTSILHVDVVFIGNILHQASSSFESILSMYTKIVAYVLLHLCRVSWFFIHIFHQNLFLLFFENRLSFDVVPACNNILRKFLDDLIRKYIEEWHIIII